MSKLTIGQAVKKARKVYVYFTPAAMPATLKVRVTKTALREMAEDLRNLNNTELCDWTFDKEQTLHVHIAT